MEDKIQVQQKLEDFKKFWNDEISKIEVCELDVRAARLIYLKHNLSEQYLNFSIPDYLFNSGLIMELDMIEAKLIRAVETARVRYQLKARSLWVRIVESLATAFGGLYKTKIIEAKASNKLTF
jgi:hypothetical protein